MLLLNGVWVDEGLFMLNFVLFLCGMFMVFSFRFKGFFVICLNFKFWVCRFVFVVSLLVMGLGIRCWNLLLGLSWFRLLLDK